MRKRVRPNKAVVALAAKISWIVWVILTTPGVIYDRRPTEAVTA